MPFASSMMPLEVAAAIRDTPPRSRQFAAVSSEV